MKNVFDGLSSALGMTEYEGNQWKLPVLRCKCKGWEEWDRVRNIEQLNGYIHSGGENLIGTEVVFVVIIWHFFKINSQHQMTNQGQWILSRANTKKKVYTRGIYKNFNIVETKGEKKWKKQGEKWFCLQRNKVWSISNFSETV